MAIPRPLRVVDYGGATPLRSQTVWHAIAHGVSEGSPPTLSFVRPDAPYVSIGYHRRLGEVDLDTCSRRGWPVFRRMVGGGPVFCDSGQLFFQISVPAASVPPARRSALRWLLEPTVEAFRAAGVPAELDHRLEVVVGDRKICGYGAGQIGSAAVVVGNLIETFDHEAAASSLRTPSATARAELERLMRRYVAATPADPRVFRDAAVAAYSRSLGLDPETGELSEIEQCRLAELDLEFVDPAWLEGADRPAPTGWQGKVRSGVWVFAAADGATELTVGVDDGRLVSVHLSDPALNGATAPLEDSLVGRDLVGAVSALEQAGPPGVRLADLLGRADPRRL
jgi:lipoate-protein ligase A